MIERNKNCVLSGKIETDLLPFSQQRLVTFINTSRDERGVRNLKFHLVFRRATKFI
jgi:hypothetical protein